MANRGVVVTFPQRNLNIELTQDRPPLVVAHGVDPLIGIEKPLV